MQGAVDLVYVPTVRMKVQPCKSTTGARELGNKWISSGIQRMCILCCTTCANMNGV